MISWLKNILKGAGSLLEISPSNNYILPGDKTDAEKLHGDWQKVGEDLRKSFPFAINGKKKPK